MNELFVLSMMAFLLLAGSAGAAVPAMDAAPRGKTETATFALG